jgi:hypothetical protein
MLDRMLEPRSEEITIRLVRAEDLFEDRAMGSWDDWIATRNLPWLLVRHR